MGGIGYIEDHKAACMLSVLINSNLLLAVREQELERYFFSSSACVYPVDKQRSSDVKPLAEGDAYPALPEDGYGWEKLFSERMCHHFNEDFGLETSVARTTMSTAHMASSMEGEKKLRRRSAARSPRRNSPECTRSRSGAMASKPGASCTSMTASGNADDLESGNPDPINLG